MMVNTHVASGKGIPGTFVSKNKKLQSVHRGDLLENRYIPAVASSLRHIANQATANFRNNKADQ